MLLIVKPSVMTDPLTGYMLPRTISCFSGVNRRYSPLKGTMRGSLSQPDFADNLSDCKPPQVTTCLQQRTGFWEQQ